MAQKVGGFLTSEREGVIGALSVFSSNPKKEFRML